MKTVFSGIQPTGALHLGNYIGAMKQWVELQDESEAIFCIVDLHAITIPQDPSKLREKVLETAALYLACGVDPKRSNIFIQSENFNHTYLAWILDCIAPFGQLERMTQFKDKSQKEAGATTVGLFNYPILMASDILLYGTDEVPVGDDQKQHIELTRDIAEKFNREYGETFKLPVPRIQKETARIMSLSNPNFKMSKSDSDQSGCIYLLDSEDVIREKIKKAVTDSGEGIRVGEDKPAISNLLKIFEVVSGKTADTLEEEYGGSTYSMFKASLADSIVEFLKPIQEKYKKFTQEQDRLNEVLDNGRDYAINKSTPLLERVKKSVGITR